MKKKSKLPIISVVALLLVASLGGGFFAGRALHEGGSNIMNEISADLGIEFGNGREEPGTAVPEQTIEIQPVPEVTDGGYDTTQIYEMVNPSVVNITVYIYPCSTIRCVLKFCALESILSFTTCACTI